VALGEGRDRSRCGGHFVGDAQRHCQFQFVVVRVDDVGRPGARAEVLGGQTEQVCQRVVEVVATGDGRCRSRE
jgi:hypothetical protein